MTELSKESERDAGVASRGGPGQQTTVGQEGRSKDKTDDNAAKVRRQAKDAAQQAKEGLKDAGQAVAENATKATNSAKEKGKEFFQQQKGRLAGEIGACSSSLREAAEKYDAESEANLGRYATTAAEAMDRAKSYLEDRDLPELMNDAEDAIRNHREMAYGACFLVGLGLARFLKASKNSPSRPTNEPNGRLSPARATHSPIPAVPRGESRDSPSSMASSDTPHFSASPSGSTAKQTP